MAFFKVALSMLLIAGSYARPQTFDDFNSQVTQNLQADMFDPNPVYTYSYQVAADTEQTYIAHQESRDGADVQGEYSYVDPLGSLITVTYTAGADGYQETRNVQENFVSIRSKPAVAVQTTPAIQTVVEQVRPAIQTVVQQNTGSGDADLVARIIAQLTPFIRDTVSTSLGGSNTQTTTTTIQSAPQPIAPVRTTTLVQAAPVQSSSSTASIFGTGGANNVRLETPEFNFAYDLEK